MSTDQSAPETPAAVETPAGSSATASSVTDSKSKSGFGARRMDAKTQENVVATESAEVKARAKETEEVHIWISVDDRVDDRVEAVGLVNGSVLMRFAEAIVKDGDGREKTIHRYEARVRLPQGMHYFGVRVGDSQWHVADSHSSVAMRSAQFNVLRVPSHPLIESTDFSVVTKHKDRVYSVHCTDEWTVAGSTDKSATVIQNATKRVVHTLEGHRDYITSVHISADNKWLATASKDTSVKIWDLVLAKCNRTLEFSDSVSCARFSRDCTLIAVCLYNGSTVVHECSGDWSQNWSVTGQSGYPFRKLTFARDNSAVAVANGTKVDILSADNGARIKRLHTAHKSNLGVEYSPSGDLLATCGTDGMLQVFRTVNYKCVASLRGHSDRVFECCFLEDSLIASVSRDGTVNIWSVPSGLCLAKFEAHSGKLFSISVVANGSHFATGSRHGSVHFWDTPVWFTFTPIEFSNLSYIVATKM